ncbi:hypothetical protein CHU95_01340 [Niveispirillum lacus]|uniref:Uncharacterized protein n=1 Tax=Niveispirillum lacus TaxID=1981099 RepID=A0A255Z741_9PROT|nr:hypothetical protein CHU95_01340 [Niveispirillum lacus]
MHIKNPMGTRPAIVVALPFSPSDHHDVILGWFGTAAHTVVVKAADDVFWARHITGLPGAGRMVQAGVLTVSGASRCWPALPP